MRKHIFFIIILSLFVLQCNSVSPLDTKPDDKLHEIETIIDTKMKEMNLPGVIVSIWMDGREKYQVKKGKADIDKNTDRNIDDQFRIASITKTFVATAVLQLVDEGKLKTSDKLSEFFPDFPNADKITVRNLLRMRSGIADFANADFLEIVYKSPLKYYTPDELINMSALMKDKFEEPGQKTKYSNVNYTILGEIVKKVSGMDIGTFIRKKIFEPLKMTSSIYPTDSTLPGILHGYSWNTSENSFDDMTVLDPRWAGTAGGIISNIPDLNIYVKALYKGDLLSKETRKTRLESMSFDDLPEWLQYGEGIAKFGSFWGHNGTIFGFSSEMWYLPEKDAVVLINVNRLDLDDKSKSTDIFMAITKLVFPEYVNW